MNARRPPKDPEISAPVSGPPLIWLGCSRTVTASGSDTLTHGGRTGTDREPRPTQRATTGATAPELALYTSPIGRRTPRDAGTDRRSGLPDTQGVRGDTREDESRTEPQGPSRAGRPTQDGEARQSRRLGEVGADSPRGL